MFTIQTVDLPDPNLNETESLPLEARVEKYRAGARRSTIKRGQGKNFSYVFENVSPATYTSLRAAMSANFILSIIDHQGRSFNAIATRSTFVTSSRDEYYTITLDLRSV